jgi:hypothetical protein
MWLEKVDGDQVSHGEARLMGGHAMVIADCLCRQTPKGYEPGWALTQSGKDDR